jgi:hypothetical protein
MTDPALRAPPAPPAPIRSSDAAWVTIPTRLAPEELYALCRDLEAIFRANPYLYFQSWRQTGADSYQAECRNESIKQDVVLDMRVRPAGELGFAVEYARGIKNRTVFTVEPAAGGSRLTIADDYEGTPHAERERRADEVDKSLPAWGEALRVYFLRFRRYGWVPGWRWYIRRLWIPMKPSAKRIVWLLWLITVVEFAFFLFVLLIYVLEQDK